MKATAFEFRYRYLLHTVIFALGLWAPWTYLLPADPTGVNAHTWGALALLLSRKFLLSYGQATEMLLGLGIVLAASGAAVRTWGSAYVGAGVVESGQMFAGVVTDGPYRYLRNPLYVGTVLHTLALALLMPPSGAAFAIVATVLLQVRLILGEETFLTAKLGPEYTAYERLVPSVVPRLRSRVTPSGRVPRWGRALLSEIYMWGVAGSFAFAGWQYNAVLLVQCAVVSFGVAILVKAVRGPERVVAPEA